MPAPVFERCAEAEGIAADALEFRVPVVRDEQVARPLLALNRLLLSEHGTLASLVTRSPGETMVGVTPQEALVLAIATVVRHHGGRRSNGAMHTDSAIVRVAKEVIHSRYADSDMTSLDSLAATVGVTSFHLVRTFTRSIGMSPHQYLLQVRVERARRIARVRRAAVARGGARRIRRPKPSQRAFQAICGDDARALSALYQGMRGRD